MVGAESKAMRVFPHWCHLPRFNKHELPFIFYAERFSAKGTAMIGVHDEASVFHSGTS